MNILRRVGLLLVSAVMLSPIAQAAPFGYAADGDTSVPAPFYRIDFATNTITQIGTTNPRLEALSFGPGGSVLYGISDSTDTLYTVSTSNAALTTIGPLNIALSGAPGSPPSRITDPGLAFCPDNGTMYMSDGAELGRLFTVSLSTGQLTYIGQGVAGLSPTSYNPSGLACSKTGVLYAASSTGNESSDSLYTINRSTGQATVVGLLGIDISNSGLGDLGSRLVLVTDRTPTILYEVNRSTGAATVLTELSASGLNLESLAVDVEAAGGPLEAPAIPTLSEWLMLLLAGLVGSFGYARLRRA